MLLALKVLYPEHVHLNRGNHEDLRINEAYGFAKEVRTKYDNSMISKFGEVFSALPYGVIVEGTHRAVTVGSIPDGLFVVHAGLPSEPGMGVKQINAIDRKYKPSIMSSIKVVQELLWSDPAAEHGFSPSYRVRDQ